MNETRSHLMTAKSGLGYLNRCCCRRRSTAGRGRVFTTTHGRFGGYCPKSNVASSEGFVVRNRNSFIANGGSIPVAVNEFNNLFKVVRQSHVKTDVHWSKTWTAATLVDYTKYNWYAYEYLGRS